MAETVFVDTRVTIYTFYPRKKSPINACHHNSKWISWLGWVKDLKSLQQRYCSFNLNTKGHFEHINWSFVVLECNNLHPAVSMFCDGWTCSGTRTCIVRTCRVRTCVCFSVKWIDLLQWIRLLIGLSASLTASRERSVSHCHVLLFSFTLS